MKGKDCDPNDIAVKSFFLGPQAENREVVKELIKQIFHQWFDWRRSLFPEDGCAITASDRRSPSFRRGQEKLINTTKELLRLFEEEVPKFSPRYIGHMFSEISLPALMGHFVALLHNPNNVSDEASKIGSLIESEAVGYLNEMIGFNSVTSMGHFTSGGTIANFEGLLRTRARMAKWLSLAAFINKRRPGIFSLFSGAHMGWPEFERLYEKWVMTESDKAELDEYNFVEANPYEISESFEGLFQYKFYGPVVLVPENKHYSWQKGVSILGMGESSFWPISLDEKGHLDVEHLKESIERAQEMRRPVMMVVSVAGTTELGEIDPVNEIQDKLDQYKEQGIHIWHHVDAAYGGFYCSFRDMKNCPLDLDAIESLKALARADSVTLDPHKLGYVPFSSGAFLCRQRIDYHVKGFGAPYVDFKQGASRGLYTIEGSRSAAGATATWLTARVIGFCAEGYGRILARSIHAKKELEQKLKASGLPIRIAPHGDTNILCFAVADEGEPVSKSNLRTQKIFDVFHPLGKGPFFVSKTVLDRRSYGKYMDGFMPEWKPKRDSDTLTLIRLCLMNPFLDSKETEIDYIDEFIKKLGEVVNVKTAGQPEWSDN